MTEPALTHFWYNGGDDMPRRTVQLALRTAVDGLVHTPPLSLTPKAVVVYRSLMDHASSNIRLRLLSGLPRARHCGCRPEKRSHLVNPAQWAVSQ
jgi:hypothetical protein